MSLMRGILNRTERYTESNGYYERVPIRVKSFVLVKNEKSRVVYETTSREFCNKGPKVSVSITTNNDGNWSVNFSQGGISGSITPSDNLSDKKISRRRAFWHAGQYMAGRELNNKETFSLTYQASVDNESIFEADAFFKDGDPITIDPFGEFLEK